MSKDKWLASTSGCEATAAITSGFESLKRTEPRVSRQLKRLLYAGAALALGSAAAFSHGGMHGLLDGHLAGPGAWGNITLVSKHKVPGAEQDLIADVTAFGNYAYLANWGVADCAGPETGGVNTPDAGAWVIDISDPKKPKNVTFIPMPQDTRPGEGMQVLRMNTKWFKGDMLVMNAESCGKNYKGGFMLYDVTNPEKPVMIKEGFGDRTGSDANQTHSAYAWTVGGKAYLVAVDNEDVSDIDIFDITNPRRPRQIADLDLNPLGVAQLDLNLGDSFHHDVTVKKIGEKYIMSASYWDGGYAILDVTDPANPVLLDDTDFAAVDPELLQQTGVSLTPEGNAHQSEFTKPNWAGKRFLIATDEDFSPYRAVVQSDDGGSYAAAEFGWTVPINTGVGTLNGPTVYGGYGCPGDRANIPTADAALGTQAAGVERILVLQRGPLNDSSQSQLACLFSEKVETAQLLGYDAAVIANHHDGSLSGAAPEAYLCGSQGHTFNVSVSAVCVGHGAMHELFDDANPADNYTYPEATPAVGAVGDSITVTTQFDGWGYVHLFDATSVATASSPAPNVDLVDVDTFAIPEAMDPAKASGFGDLSVHEVATDPKRWDRAYLSYYSGGLRSLQIQCTNNADPSTCKLAEIGGYLDPLGNDFWGVEVIPDPSSTTGGQLILGSDRDYGLFIFRAK